MASLLVLVSLSAPAATAAPAAPAVARPAAVAPAALPAGFWDSVCGASWGMSAACATVKEVKKKTKEAFVETLESTTVKPIAQALADFTATTLRETLTWWLTMKSVQIKDSGVTTVKAPECQKPEKATDGEQEQDPRCKGSAGASFNSVSLQAIMFGIGVMIATLLTIIQGIRTAIRRKGTPLLEAVQGLMVAVLVSAIGITVIDALLVASDTLTEAILDVSFGGRQHAPDVIVKVLLPALENPMGMIVIAAIVLLVGLCQVVLLFLRQAAVPIQGLLLPIAAAGQVGGSSTRQWLPRLATAIMTVIVYKPMAAVILSVGFLEMSNAPTMVDWTRGVVTLVLSVFALKALISIFSPLGVAMTGGGSGGAGLSRLLDAAGDLMARRGNGGGDGGPSAPTSATQHAEYMDRQNSGNGPDTPPASSNTAVQHANSTDTTSSPNGGTGGGAGQPGAPGAPGAAGTAGEQAPAGAAGTTGGATGGAQTAGTGASVGGGATGSAAAGGGAAAAAGPVGIAIVAAEAAHQGIQTAGNTMSEGSKQ
ncbi:hypothetical protein [Streptomyces sp. URMC 123]|uniref:hypothetical protein n=1 Tax=Streptomyces sp. URMC 123 TaxID=3423403 RepID=UPI003F1B4A1C